MRTNHLLKSAAVFLLVLLVSCEKEIVVLEPENEPVTIEPSHNSSVTTDFLSEKEVAQLIGYIEKRTGKSVSKDGHGGTYLETEFGTIYLDHALRATDTLGKSNISFRIYPDEPQPRLTFNLVVGHAPEGQERPIYVIGLEKSEAYYAGEMAGTNSPADFSGKLHRYPIDGSILNGKNLSAKELCEPMDVNPGPEPVDDGGGNGGGGGGGGNMGPGPGPGSGDGGGGVYYPCTVTIVYDNCSVGGNADGHGPQEQEGGGYCSGSPIVAVYYSGDCGIDDQMNKAATSSKGDGCPELDGPVPIEIYAHIVQTLDAALDLTPQQEAFLLEPNNEPFLQDLHNFWYFCDKSEENKDRALDAVDACMEGYGVISIAPFIKYPKNSNYETLYPKLTEYLKNKLPNVANIPKITDAIQEFTQLPLNQIQNNLQWGEGPEVHVVQLDNYKPGETDDDTAGYFDSSTPDRIYLDVDYVNIVENETSDPDAMIFWIGTTVLHEYIHYGNCETGFEFAGEDGRLFETKVYGFNVQPDTARLVLDRLN
ncbi:MAG: hypothetical protein ACX93O_15595 [Flagellimonas sp.]